MTALWLCVASCSFPIMQCHTTCQVPMASISHLNVPTQTIQAICLTHLRRLCVECGHRYLSIPRSRRAVMLAWHWLEELPMWTHNCEEQRGLARGLARRTHGPSKCSLFRTI